MTDDSDELDEIEVESDEAAGVGLLKRARRVRKLLRAPAAKVDLSNVDPRSTPGLPPGRPDNAKAWSRIEVARLGAALASHQERIYADAVGGGGRRRVLLILQAMDCGGKDGTVKSVIGGMDPLGIRITAFGRPTPEELQHDFLWRIHRAVPQAGYFGVFNRSQYEDVLAVRVRELVPPRVWQARYSHINEFESQLTFDGVTIVKIMLHISYAEQRERLRARLDNPHKHWKFNPGDVDDRALWPRYQAAYEDVLRRCNPRHAPWYIVPADRKWYRNWAVANILLAHFAELEASFPVAEFDVEAQRKRLLEEAGAESARQT